MKQEILFVIHFILNQFYKNDFKFIHSIYEICKKKESE